MSYVITNKSMIDKLEKIFRYFSLTTNFKDAIDRESSRVERKLKEEINAKNAKKGKVDDLAEIDPVKFAQALKKWIKD